MTVPIRSSLAGSGAISAPALADLLGHWSTPEGPLYRLLSARLARLADTGALTAGLRLPAERDLAAQLSVSRNTVAMAYQTLRDEGMAESRQGSGTRIVPHRTTPAATHRANGFFTNLLESSRVRADLTFAQGECAPQVAAAVADPSSVLSPAKLQAITGSHGYYPLGFPGLRAAIAEMLTARYGVPTAAAEVIVTTGAQQALDLLARDEVLPGGAAIVEEPTFAGMIDILHRAGARLVALPPGDRDDTLDRLVDTHAPALVYLVPTHHNPLGLVMPEEVRRRVVRLASRHPGTTFIDDMVLADLALTDAQRPPPLAALAPRQPNIVTVGSLSKGYWGGLRIGWVRAPASVIARLGATKAVADLGSPPLGQAVAAALISEQHDDIVKWRQDWLRTRYDALTGALAEQLPSWRWPRPEGGSAIWVRIPSGVDAFTQAALRAGVAVLPGRLLTVGSKPSDHLRLAFTADPAVLIDAVATLATVPGAVRGLRWWHPLRLPLAAMEYEYLSVAISSGHAARVLPRWAARAMRDVADGRRSLRAAVHPLGFTCLPVVREGHYGVCVHVWQPGQPRATSTTSQVHAHSWDLVSYVLFGQLRNELPVVTDAGPAHPSARRVLEVRSRGNTDDIVPTPRLVSCEDGDSELAVSDDVYRVPA
ncbi:MAG: PLP-dependent aminotransferase family protein, partial [Streptosporangiaceae bacterium]